MLKVVRVLPALFCCACTRTLASLRVLTLLVPLHSLGSPLVRNFIYDNCQVFSLHDGVAGPFSWPQCPFPFRRQRCTWFESWVAVRSRSGGQEGLFRRLNSAAHKRNWESLAPTASPTGWNNSVIIYSNRRYRRAVSSFQGDLWHNLNPSTFFPVYVLTQQTTCITTAAQLSRWITPVPTKMCHQSAYGPYRAISARLSLRANTW